MRKTSRQSSKSTIRLLGTSPKKIKISKEILGLPVDEFVEVIKEIPPSAVNMKEAGEDIRKSLKKASKMDNKLVGVLKDEEAITVKNENGAIGIEKIKDVVEYEQPSEGLLGVVAPIVKALATTAVTVGGMIGLVYIATKVLSVKYFNYPELSKKLGYENAPGFLNWLLAGEDHGELQQVLDGVKFRHAQGGPNWMKGQFGPTAGPNILGMTGLSNKIGDFTISGITYKDVPKNIIQYLKNNALQITRTLSMSDELDNFLVKLAGITGFHW